jgi:protein-S-isoprenylcysteine O-methyltransferase Ste14
VEAFVQVVGALLVLAGFGAAQYGVLDLRSVPYLLLNLAGSAVLAVDALLGREWGFLLLEGVWAVVSAGSLLSLARGRARDRVST